MKKILSSFIFLLFFFLIPTNVFAKGEFIADYKVNYEVALSGDTTVTEDITLTNQTDRYYPSAFSLTIGASNIKNVEAYDSVGKLPVDVQNLGKKIRINVKFNNQQLVGVNKKYIWSLKFNTPDFAQAQGKIWQVSVPKIANEEDINSYNLTLAVPVDFGDPTTMIPEPNKLFESGGKLNFVFDKAKLSENGILANFGSNQMFDYTLTYHLANDSVLPALAKLSLPSENEYQEVILENLDPKPENVFLDEDGNNVAFYKLDRKQNLEVKLKGLVKLYVKPNKRSRPLSDEEKKKYLSEQKYWDSNSPQIKDKLKEIFKDGEPKTVIEKARLINNLVVNLLQYDEGRLKSGEFQRLGGLTALSNPTKALCSEYTDLFISLARAAGIPSRQLVGYAYTANTEIRPLSLDGAVLHTWPEYYDDSLGWLMIDPTWQSTTGGVDYFSKFDLNHFVLVTRGFSPISPIAPDMTDVKFYEGDFIVRQKVGLGMDVLNELYAGFPAKVKVKVENQGSGLYPQIAMVLSSANIIFSDKITPNSTIKNYKIGPIPPFGYVEIEYNLLTGPIWKSFEDVIDFKVGEADISQKIIVRPFFAYRFFIYITSAVILGVGALYIFLVWYHLKTKAPHVSIAGGHIKKDR